MSKIVTIYEKESIVSHTRLTIEGEKLRYIIKEFDTVKNLVIPIHELKKEIYFDKSHHFIMILLSIICFVLSCLLLYKYQDMDDWRVFLALGVLSMSLVAFLYLTFVERKYGILVIKYRDGSVKIRTKELEYLSARELLIDKIISANEK